MRARDIMTTTVRTISPDAPVRDAARLMAMRRVSAIPVVDRRRCVIGIVSEGDLLHRRETGTLRRRSWWLGLLSDPRSDAREYAKSRAIKVRDVMTRTVISVAPDTDVAGIAELLEARGIKRVPVIQKGALMGIVSRGDLVRALARQAVRPKGTKVADSRISADLQHEIDSIGWVNKALINVTVRKGAVELGGFVGSADQRKALHVMAEAIPGVRAVRNRTAVMPRLASGI